jgi:hypothetical protein
MFCYQTPKLGHVPAVDEAGSSVVEEASSVVEAGSTRVGITGTMCARTTLDVLLAMKGTRTFLFLFLFVVVVVVVVS